MNQPDGRRRGGRGARGGGQEQYQAAPGRARGRGVPPRDGAPLRAPHAAAASGAPYAQRTPHPRVEYPGSEQAGPSQMRETEQQVMDLQISGPSSGESSNVRAGGYTRKERSEEERKNIGTVYTRPESSKNSKKGTSGDRIKLKTNYFRLLTHAKWVLYQYRVDISPIEDRTVVRKALLRDHKDKLNGYIFDGTVLYTPHKLSQLVFYSKMRETDINMTITLKLVGDVVPGDYSYIQVFNIIMRKCYSSLQLQLIGRDYFDRNAQINIPEYRLQIWPGYKTTISQYESSIMMVAEITHKVLRMETVLDLFRGYSDNLESFKKEITGQIVLTTYNNKTYRVNDITFNVNPTHTFDMNGEKKTFKDYYREKYQLQVTQNDQPLLISATKKRDQERGLPKELLLVPEFCRLTGLTDTMRSDFRLMKAINTYTRVSPEERIKKLLAFNARLLNSPACVNDFRLWNMKLDNKLVEIDARRLSQELIYQGAGGSVRYPSGDTNDGWTKNLRSNHMLSIGDIKTWSIITSQRLTRDTNEFVKKIMSAGDAMGLRLPRPNVHELRNDGMWCYMPMVDEVLSQSNPSLVLCIVPNNKAELYNGIKRKCTIDHGIPSQIVTARTLSHKSALSIATKVAIQMNCKVGGSPWNVFMPLETVMFIGYDVCHETGNKKKSYGAMVATLDKNVCRYYSCATVHDNGEELANEFSINIKKALKAYSAYNNRLPSMIIIYRDGVGEGQIPYVHSVEVERIQTALRESFQGKDFKFAFVIVTKRLNTRFFENNNNPRPGTVIDDVVTSPERYDFFLVSQAVRDGTVSPTSYNVICDNTGLSPEKMQKLTYKLCHLYYNFSGQVRVPAPCQYAHKLAFFASQNLNGTPNNKLSSTLHFL